MLLPQPLRASSHHTHRCSSALAYVALLCFVARLLAHVSRLVAALRSVVAFQPMAALRPVVAFGQWRRYEHAPCARSWSCMAHVTPQ